VGLISSIAAWFAGASFLWAVGGVLGAVVPFTLLVILPTNKQLLSATLERRSAKTERILARWVCCMLLEGPSLVRLCCCSST
jgi:Anthrone oxygenase